METPNLKTIGIGTKETPKLEALPCRVIDTEIKLVGEGKKAANKVIFHLQHPKKTEAISVSSVAIMRQRKDKKEIVSSGTWISLDEDQNLQKDSATAILLRFYQANNLAEMVDKTVQTEIGSDGYLAIKAY